MSGFDPSPIQAERTQRTGSIINRTKHSPLASHESMFISSDCLLQCANNRRPHQSWSHAAHTWADNWCPVVCCSRDPTWSPPASRTVLPPRLFSIFNIQHRNQIRKPQS
jgi:hypothetical protein